MRHAQRGIVNKFVSLAMFAATLRPSNRHSRSDDAGMIRWLRRLFRQKRCWKPFSPSSVRSLWWCRWSLGERRYGSISYRARSGSRRWDCCFSIRDWTP